MAMNKRDHEPAISSSSSSSALLLSTKGNDDKNAAECKKQKIESEFISKEIETCNEENEDSNVIELGSTRRVTVRR